MVVQTSFFRGSIRALIFATESRGHHPQQLLGLWNEIPGRKTHSSAPRSLTIPSAISGSHERIVRGLVGSSLEVSAPSTPFASSRQIMIHQDHQNGDGSLSRLSCAVAVAE